MAVTQTTRFSVLLFRFYLLCVFRMFWYVVCCVRLRMSSHSHKMRVTKRESLAYRECEWKICDAICLSVSVVCDDFRQFVQGQMTLSANQSYVVVLGYQSLLSFSRQFLRALAVNTEREKTKKKRQNYAIHVNLGRRNGRIISESQAICIRSFCLFVNCIQGFLHNLYCEISTPRIRTWYFQKSFLLIGCSLIHANTLSLSLSLFSHIMNRNRFAAPAGQKALPRIRHSFSTKIHPKIRKENNSLTLVLANMCRWTSSIRFGWIGIGIREMAETSETRQLELINQL